MSLFEKYLREEAVKYGVPIEDKCHHCKQDIKKGTGGVWKEKNLCDDCVEEVEMQGM